MAEEQEVKRDEQISALDLPDDEFLKQGGEQSFELDMNALADTEQEAPADQEDVDIEEEEIDEQIEEDDSEDDTEDDSDSDTGEEVDDTDTEEEEDQDAESDDSETDDVDFKAEYQRILSPFKANGKQIQVDNIDDAIRLMQMGAGYNRKMQILKPRLKIVKMLENNDLLDPAKINELIDLSKRDPKAVTKLVKEAGLDPLDINTDDAVDYKPKDHQISDREFELDQFITEIRDSETFDRTMDVLGKQWDDKSRDMVVKNPEFIPILDTHMQNGVYEKISSIMEQQKLLGKLKDVPDVVAYHQIGETLFKQGVLVDQGQADQPPGTGKAETSEVKKPGVKKQPPKPSRSKRRAAASSRATRTSQRAESVDILNMPDDEFMKRYS